MNALPSFASVEKFAATDAEIKREYVACPLCEGIRLQPFLRARDHGGSDQEFLVVHCSDCGLHFTNPRPTASAIKRFYPESYLPHAHPVRADRPLRGWYPFDWLMRPRSVERPRLLDFGCGTGQFLAVMQQQGWEATGLDASDSAIETLRHKRNVHALVGSLPHEEFAPGSFDLITMWHALEHVHRPLRILEEARRLLAPGGRLVLAVPNFAGCQRRWYQENWFGLDVPRHLTHFTDATLSAMLDKAGFTLRGLRHSRHSDWLRESARRTHKARLDSLFSSTLRWKPIAKAASWLLSRGNLSDAIIARAE